MDPRSGYRHLDGIEVTTPARPIPAISADRLTTSQQLSEFAQSEHQFEGTQPFVPVVLADALLSLDALTALESPIGAGKIILWHGPPGTGKTRALRARMRAWSMWCQQQYIADPKKFFAEPAYMTQVLTNVPVAKVGPSLTRAAEPESVWRLVVAEDSDEYLRARADMLVPPSADCSTWPSVFLDEG